MPRLASLTSQQLAGVGITRSSSVELVLVYTLDNPNAFDTSAGDQFGASVAISGDRAIVSAPSEDDAGGTGSGKAYIFDVTSGSIVHTLDNPNAFGTSQNDFFGESVAVAISGDRAIVGAPSEDDAGGTSSGKAYIFDVTSGALVHTLDNPTAFGTSAGDQFGRSVAISGNRAIVGALGEADAGGSSSGKAYIFDVTSGNLLYTLDNPNVYSTVNTQGGDEFGRSVAISGDRAIVSATGEDEAGGAGSGKVYIYDITTFTTPTISNATYVLDNPNAFNTPLNDQFGWGVAISGDRAIVSAYFEDDASGSSSGKAYIYDITTFTTPTISNATYVLDNPNAFGTSAGDQFGISVAISGDYAIVGAYLEDDAGGGGSGKAYVYDITTFTTPTISNATFVLDNPNAFGTSASDLFGRTVAIDGNSVIVGAPSEDDGGTNGAGKAYLYALT